MSDLCARLNVNPFQIYPLFTELPPIIPLKPLLDNINTQFLNILEIFATGHLINKQQLIVLSEKKVLSGDLKTISNVTIINVK